MAGPLTLPGTLGMVDKFGNLGLRELGMEECDGGEAAELSFRTTSRIGPAIMPNPIPVADCRAVAANTARLATSISGLMARWYTTLLARSPDISHRRLLATTVFSAP